MVRIEGLRNCLKNKEKGIGCKMGKNSLIFFTQTYKKPSGEKQEILKEESK